MPLRTPRSNGETPAYIGYQIPQEEKGYEDALEINHIGNVKDLLIKLFGNTDNFLTSYKDRYKGVRQYKPAWDFVEMDKEMTFKKIRERGRCKRKFKIPSPSSPSNLCFGTLRKFANQLQSSESPFWEEPSFIYVFFKAIEKFILASATFILSIPFTLLEHVLPFSTPSQTNLSGWREPSRAIQPPQEPSTDSRQVSQKSYSEQKTKRVILRRRNKKEKYPNVSSVSLTPSNPGISDTSKDNVHPKSQITTHSTEGNEIKPLVYSQSKNHLIETPNAAVTKGSGDVRSNSEAIPPAQGQSHANETSNQSSLVPQNQTNSSGLTTFLKKKSIQLVGKQGEPILLFNTQGYPLSDECGRLLTDPDGKFLVVCDPENYPICCRNGDSIYLRDGASWLSYKEKSFIKVIVENDTAPDAVTKIEGEEQKEVLDRCESVKVISRKEQCYEIMPSDCKQYEVQLQEFFPTFPVHKLFAKFEKVQAGIKTLSEESINAEPYYNKRPNKTVELEELYHRQWQPEDEIDEQMPEFIEPKYIPPRAPISIHSLTKNDPSTQQFEVVELNYDALGYPREKSKARRLRKRDKTPLPQPTVIYRTSQKELQEFFQSLKVDMNVQKGAEPFPAIESTPSLSPGEYLRRCINEYTKTRKFRKKKNNEESKADRHKKKQP